MHFEVSKFLHSSRLEFLQRRWCDRHGVCTTNGAIPMEIQHETPIDIPKWGLKWEKKPGGSQNGWLENPIQAHVLRRSKSKLLGVCFWIWEMLKSHQSDNVNGMLIKVYNSHHGMLSSKVSELFRWFVDSHLAAPWECYFHRPHFEGRNYFVYNSARRCLQDMVCYTDEMVSTASS